MREKLRKENKMGTQQVVADSGVQHHAGTEEAILTLRAALELAAGEADVHHEPLYGWLLKRLDARRPVPMHGVRPNVRLIQREIGRKLSKTVDARAIVDDWAQRFSDALGQDVVDAFPDLALRATRPLAPARAAALAPLLSQLEAEAAAAWEPDRVIYRWLAARLRVDAGLPMSGARVNLTSVSHRTGVGYGKVLKWGPILTRWARRIDDVATSGPAPRDRLPGSDETGAAVPGRILVAALEEAIRREERPGRAKLLRHLLAIATGDRTIPRANDMVHKALLLAQAGVTNEIGRVDTNEILNDWLSFFHLDHRRSQVQKNGTVTRERVASLDVQEYVNELRDDGMAPLAASRQYPDTPSYAAIERELNIPIANDPHCRQIVMAYWAEAGPGPIYEGRPAHERRLRDLRRTELLEFAGKRVKAGLPLPGNGNRRPSPDYDALVAMVGTPGPNLADDWRFKSLLRKLKPTYANLEEDRGTVTSYAQLAAKYASHRLKSVGKTSEAATRVKVNSAIETFRNHFGKDAHHAIGADMDDDRFEEIVDEIFRKGAWGSQPQNWRSEIRKAQKWFSAHRGADMLGDNLADVLDGAVRQDGRKLKEILEGTAFTTGQVVSWMDGKTQPAKEALTDLAILETNLKLDPGRLTKLVGAQPMSTGQVAGLKLKDGVRPFLPNDWQRRDPDEVRSMMAWIEANLTHRNSAHGHAMRAVAAKRFAKAGAPTSSTPEEEEEEAEKLALLDAAEKIAGEQMDCYLEGGGARLGKRVSGELAALRRHMIHNFPTDLRRPGVKWEPGSTAPMKIGMLTRFLRWQTLSEEDGGLGRSPDDLTLADLLHPPLLFAYVDFKAASLQHVEFEGRRRGKVFTGTEVDVLRLAKSLLDEDYGFVKQRPKYVERMVADDRLLPAGTFINPHGDLQEEDVLDADLDEEERDRGAPPILPAELCGLQGQPFLDACRRARLAYGSAQSHVDGEAVMVRDPMEAIAPILDSPQPMTTLLRQIALASRKVPSLETNAIQHHRHMRDVLICRLLALTSLRNKNLRQITIDGPNPKLRYDDRKGKWLLQINWREFKNYKSAVLFGRANRKQAYRKWIEDTNGLYDLIAYYRDRSRPFFIEQGRKERRIKPRRTSGTPRELFLTTTGRRIEGPGLWSAIYRFTARHVAWNPFRDEGITLCQPFGPHAFRDIRATDILLNPETANPFLEAALALQTSPQMIQDHYGVVKVEKRTAADDISFQKRENLAWAGLEMAA